MKGELVVTVAPTAQTLSGEVAATPPSPALSIPLSVQVRPFQCAIAAPSAVTGPLPPTAQTLLAEVAVTAPRS